VEEEARFFGLPFRNPSAHKSRETPVSKNITHLLTSSLPLLSAYDRPVTTV